VSSGASGSGKPCGRKLQYGDSGWFRSRDARQARELHEQEERERRDRLASRGRRGIGIGALASSLRGRVEGERTEIEALPPLPWATAPDQQLDETVAAARARAAAAWERALPEFLRALGIDQVPDVVPYTQESDYAIVKGVKIRIHRSGCGFVVLVQKTAEAVAALHGTPGR
jgi:hypothetical protein